VKTVALRALEDMRPPQTPARPVVPGWPDAAIADLAGRQQTMIASAQLRELGVSSSAIDRALRRGRLHRVHRGVYSLVAARGRPPLARERAAVLAAGPRAVVSHETAARLHGINMDTRNADGAIHVTVVATHRHPRCGLIVHRTRDLDPAEHHRRNGLPVTSVARTVLDVAPTLGEAALAATIDRSLTRTSATKLREAIARHPGRPGTSRVAALLDPTRPSADTWSAAERRLLALIRQAELPIPEANVSLGRYTPDLLWRAERVVVEYDSDAVHSGPAAVRWDTARHNELTAMGLLVLHFTREELGGHQTRLLVQIAAALARARP
jgi:very-short-patch-repair endonuclease/predicted transcriptional regulator of viral defense system